MNRALALNGNTQTRTLMWCGGGIYQSSFQKHTIEIDGHECVSIVYQLNENSSN